MADTTSVKSTYGTYLAVKDTDSYKILCPIQDFPDLGGDPEMLQTTTLSDAAHTYIKGIQSMDSLQFTTNLYFGEDSEEGSFLYIKKKYDKADINDFVVVFTKDPAAGTELTAGVQLTAHFKGQLAIWANGGGVDEVVKCTISISPSTEITYSATMPA